MKLMLDGVLLFLKLGFTLALSVAHQLSVGSDDETTLRSLSLGLTAGKWYK